MLTLFSPHLNLSLVNVQQLQIYGAEASSDLCLDIFFVKEGFLLRTRFKRDSFIFIFSLEGMRLFCQKPFKHIKPTPYFLQTVFVGLSVFIEV